MLSLYNTRPRICARSIKCFTAFSYTRFASSKAKAVTSLPPPAQLGVKELIKRDIQHAEQLGVLVPPDPNANTFRKIIHSTLELTKFYFRGAKLIYTRRKDISEIRARIKSGSSPITRVEARLIEQQRKDVNKVIPFLVLAVFLEEVIPIIAIYAPFMLPSTCILPAQRDRIEEKKTAKAITSATESINILKDLTRKAIDEKLSVSTLRGNGGATVLCSLLRLPTFGNDFLRIWRIKRHLNFIGSDDSLLLRDNLLHALNDHDLEQALEERGFILQGLNKKEQKARLEWWLSSIKDHPLDDVVARRLFLLVQRK